MKDCIVEAFPTLIYKDVILNEEECDFIRNINWKDTKFFTNHPLLLGISYTSFDIENMSALDYISENGINLKNRIQDVVNGFCELTHRPIQKLTNSWINLQGEYAKLSTHNHFDESSSSGELSGALYITVDDNSSSLSFLNPNPYYRNPESLTIKPENGMIILFPNWLLHGSDINYSKDRTVLSFNTGVIRD